MKNLLERMEKKHEYLVCIDSDGCVFDNMGLKHKECFCPATINCWDLQAVAGYAREAAEFVNLYSRTRGMNRYPALIKTLELLGERKEASGRGYKVPDLTPLKKWISESSILSVSSLTEYMKTHDEPILRTAARWSIEVDDNINKIVRNVPPLPYVKESLIKLKEFADIVIVSATPHEAIVREWTDNGLIEYVSEVAGQELGSKTACIAAVNTGERYSKDRTLMIGDAPGDMDAANSNEVKFYPIIPGKEDFSWKRMLTTASDWLKNDEYSEGKESSLINEFLDVLPINPPWIVL
jgi:phosphoglycolate phosphatase-like HAD superfamily hydrolase